jgi:predicted RNase H-like HicB family nuclease
MRKATYFAIFEPSVDGFGVYFPDLPGCVSFGCTFAEALASAVDALGLHIYGMEKDGEEIPAPSATPQVNEETAPGYIVAPVAVYPDLVRNELDNKRVSTNVTLPAWLKETAEQNRVNYSRLLETALMEYLDLPSHR